MGRARRILLGGATLTGALGGAYGLLVRGALTLDLGLGRTLRPLGPVTRQIAAPPEVVFDVISAPYLGRTPRALERKLRVIERGEDMVLAEHYTPVGRLMATTLEIVRFEYPRRVSFRLVRGPVPHVAEEFLLRQAADGTELDYSGELGTDLWALGRWWGERVAERWEAAVRSSLEGVKAEAERRARHR
jgi:hypothetical protein